MIIRRDPDSDSSRSSHQPGWKPEAFRPDTALDPTSGLCVRQFRSVNKLAQDEHGVVTAEAEAVAERDANG